jgi:hypothetical protein
MAQLTLVHNADAIGFYLSEGFDPPPTFLGLTPEEIAADEARQRAIADRRKCIRIIGGSK